MHPNYGADPSGGCQFSTETESAYLTYGALAARALAADVSIVALSGWGAYRSNGNGKLETLGNVYENTLGVNSMPKWAFDTKPDAVVVNLDIPAVEKPEAVYWVDPIHKDPNQPDR